MIRFVKHKDIDPKKWNAVIQRSPARTILCTYEYLDILTGDSTWNALIMDDYQYILPLPERVKLLVRYAYTPFFLTQMGIFSEKAVSKQIVSEFFNALPKGYMQADLLLNVSNDHTSIETSTIELVSHQMSLNSPYEELFKKFSQNTQRNIKSAKKQNLTFVHDDQLALDIVRLFFANKGKEKSVKFREADYQKLLAAARKLQEEQHLDTIGVFSPEGALIAGALFLKDYDRTWFWFSGRDNRYAASKPMFFLLDEYIHQHCNQNIILDFNGSLNENVARMYRGFGGVPYPIRMINHTKRSYLNLILKFYRKLKS